MTALSALDLYKELQKYFTVLSSYKVGFSKEISPGVLQVIQHLKGDLNPEDIVPIPTTLTVVLKDKVDETKLYSTFHQSSAVYMQTFDNQEFETWATDQLIDKLTADQQKQEEKLNS